MIYGPKDDGSYGVEFMTIEGDVLAISIPRMEAHVSVVVGPKKMALGVT
jgi:hypothetical protein